MVRRTSLAETLCFDAVTKKKVLVVVLFFTFLFANADYRSLCKQAVA